MEQDELPRDIQPHQWFIGMLSDGSYRFITPDSLRNAEKFIGKVGGGIYTHAGYPIFASTTKWMNWLLGDGPTKPPIDVKEIDCSFSDEALKWLKNNEELLQEVGGKYYENIPRH